MPEHDSFSEYRRLIIKELERLAIEDEKTTLKIQDIENKLLAKLTRIEQEVILLKFKAGLASAIIGAVISTIIALLIK